MAIAYCSAGNEIRLFLASLAMKQSFRLSIFNCEPPVPEGLFQLANKQSYMLTQGVTPWLTSQVKQKNLYSNKAEISLSHNDFSFSYARIKNRIIIHIRLIDTFSTFFLLKLWLKLFHWNRPQDCHSSVLWLFWHIISFWYKNTSIDWVCEWLILALSYPILSVKSIPALLPPDRAETWESTQWTSLFIGLP
mgnify:CR=1 FL=1